MQAKYKRILIIGANGRTGVHLVALLGDRAKAFQGNVLDYDNVRAQLKDCDGVISVIGHTKRSIESLQTTAMLNITRAMQEYRVKRIISLTGTGVRLDGDKISFIDRLLNLAVILVDRTRVKDGRNHAGVLQSSSLNWTIVRVLKLTNSARQNPWSLTEHGPAEAFVSRESVAEAILYCLDNDKFINMMPVISHRPKKDD